jgi:hypothetical protein
MKLPSSVFNKRPESCPGQDDLYKHPFTRPTRLPTPDHVLLSESGLVPQCMGNPQLMYAEDIHVAINGGPQPHTSSGKVTGLPIRPFKAISPFQPGRRLQPLIVASEGSRVKLESTSYRSSSGKIASNVKHKQSEKYRRDEMGAYVQAADILRGPLHPGILSHCNVCIEDMSLHESLCSSTLPDNAAAVTTGATLKKTKNQSLEEALMWQFSIVLHIWSHEVGLRLDHIRAVAGQMRRQKQLGKNNDFAKSNKWDGDSRAEVLTEALRKMRYACEVHDVPPCACGKHEIEDWPNDALGSLMTPPSSSSRTSSMMGQKRSRETTEEEEEGEHRRARRRSNAYL